MSPPVRVRRPLLLCGLLLVLPLAVRGQSVSPQGGEYSVGNPLPGDQVFPRVGVSGSGGYVVWQDNAIDGNGLGIAARRLDQNFSGLFNVFRVNQQVAGDQERPNVSLLRNGGAAVVWQGGRAGAQNVFLRLFNANGTFVTTNDVRVNTRTNTQHFDPAVATLANGNLAVAWSSLHQDGSLQGVYARVVSNNAQFVTTPFAVNQFTTYNQRTPAVAGLTNGNFVVVWVSENQDVALWEMQSGINRVHLYARLYDPAGQPLGGEFRVNTQSNLCANPAVCGNPDGGFTVAWSQGTRLRTNQVDTADNGWDVYARSFGADGAPAGSAHRLNAFSYGDQFNPKLSALGQVHLVVWTSLRQDGSWEGVYGRLLAQGAPSGAEFRVNTTTVSKQIHPAVAADGNNRFLVVWSSFVGASSFDIQGQRYSADASLVPTPAAPFVAALSQSRLSVTWPELAGFPLLHYEVYTDGSETPAVVTGNHHVASGFVPGSTHSFQLAYVLAGGQRSLKSLPGTGRTWGEDASGMFDVPDGLPDDWQAQFFGAKPDEWPALNLDSDGDGANNWQEFLAGTNPADAASVLRARVAPTPQGRRLQWNTVPGFIYQVQRTVDWESWEDVDGPRFAAGTSDSMAVGGTQGSAFYRVIRLR